jgi:hypothetical protein
MIALADTSPKQREEVIMEGQRLWTADGRSLRLRHLESRDRLVKVAVLGKRGGVQAEVDLDERQRASLIDLLTAAGKRAAAARDDFDRDLDRLMAVNRFSGVMRCGMDHPLQGPNVGFGPDGEVRCARCREIRDEEWGSAKQRGTEGGRSRLKTAAERGGVA